MRVVMHARSEVPPAICRCKNHAAAAAAAKYKWTTGRAQELPRTNTRNQIAVIEDDIATEGKFSSLQYHAIMEVRLVRGHQCLFLYFIRIELVAPFPQTIEYPAIQILVAAIINYGGKKTEPGNRVMRRRIIPARSAKRSCW